MSTSVIATTFINAYLSDSQKVVESRSTDSLKDNKYASNDDIKCTVPLSPQNKETDLQHNGA